MDACSTTAARVRHDDDNHYDGDNDPRIYSYNSDAGMKHVEYMTNTLSLKDGANGKATDVQKSEKGAGR